MCCRRLQHHGQGPLDRQHQRPERHTRRGWQPNRQAQGEAEASSSRHRGRPLPVPPVAPPRGVVHAGAPDQRGGPSARRRMSPGAGGARAEGHGQEGLPRAAPGRCGVVLFGTHHQHGGQQDWPVVPSEYPGPNRSSSCTGCAPSLHLFAVAWCIHSLWMHL